MPTALVRRSYDLIEIVGVDNKFINARMHVNFEDALPAQTPIGCFVQATVAALIP